MRKQPEDEALFEAMIDLMIKSTKSAIAAVDDALAHIAKSDKRIAAMEAEARNKHRFR